VVSTFWQIFTTVFLVIDPLGFVPLYISITGGMEPAERRRVSKKALFIAFAVCLVFILIGRVVLTFLGVKPGAFFIAGGIMLFLTALDMLFGAARKTRTSKDEAEDYSAVAVFPLAIPMLSGPGAITSIMLFSSGATDWFAVSAMLLAAVTATLAVAAAFMKASGFLLRILGRTGVSVIERIMGILLAGMSVQFVYDGLAKLGIVPA
jgi:multiple antibiotic resistance protein